MTALFVILLLLSVGAVVYAVVLLRLAAGQREAARLRQARVRREQLLAQQRLQQLTRSAMQQMLDAARQAKQSGRWQQ